MVSSLLIAQVGRSGGTWLSQQLALDGRWLVRHEDGGLESRGVSLDDMKAQFSRNYYCDVSHLHNEIAHLLPCRKAVILRDPKEVFASYAARTPESRQRFLDRVDGMYLGIHNMLEEGAFRILFDHMVIDPSYFEWMTKELGFDIPMDKVSFDPVNQRAREVDAPPEWDSRRARMADYVWRKWS